MLKKLILHIFNKNFFLFAIISAIGLIIDIMAFWAGIYYNFDAFLANLISGFCAISFVYFFSTRFIFNNEKSGIKYFLFFISYYTFSIIIFSILIKIIIVVSHIHPLIAKIIVVPISLITNYFCSSYILSKKL